MDDKREPREFAYLDDDDNDDDDDEKIKILKNNVYVSNITNYKQWAINLILSKIFIKLDV